MAAQRWEEGQSTEKDPGKRGSEYMNQEREKEGSKECRKEGKEKVEEEGRGRRERSQETKLNQRTTATCGPGVLGDQSEDPGDSSRSLQLFLYSPGMGDRCAVVCITDTFVAHVVR